MEKKKAEILKTKKNTKKKNEATNKELKNRKNWYPVTTVKQHFKRQCKKPHESKLRKDLQEGQIVILLSGRFRGKRVVFLKRLNSGLLLVTGPYKYNGVPLKRVNAAYVIPTQTKVDIKGVADTITDDLFKRVTVKRENEKDFFEEPKDKKDRITEDRKNAQTNVDTAVKKAVDAVPELKNYLKFRFALKNGDKPHLMKF
jgi:large subunit ribosomal protein L6e